jgi:hypothetical protein
MRAYELLAGSHDALRRFSGRHFAKVVFRI